MKRIYLLLPIVAATAFATGDYYEESLPSLSVYLSYDRLPKKTVADIAHEMAPPKTKAVKFAPEIRAIADALKSGKAPASQLAKVDELLEADRNRRDRYNGALNALLHDLRDLCSGNADAAAASAYLEWRLGKAEALGYSMERDEPLYHSLSENSNSADDIEKRIAAAPDSIKPHYLYAQAAIAFRSDESDEGGFAAIVEDYPQHPRAEAAAYMVGRCLTRQSREWQDDKYVNIEPKVVAARQAYMDYLTKYPEGRFNGDVYGFLGWLERNAGKPQEALKHYTRQLDFPGHPELAVNATAEIERCFRELHDDTDGLTAALSDPRVTQAAVYFALNETEPVDSNGEFESAEFVAEWRKKLLPALSAALVKQEAAFKAAGIGNRQVASLALASSGAGEPAKGLELLARVDANASDDLLFAKAVCLQRAKRPKESAEAYGHLAKRFPHSPLATGSIARLAFALIDDHRAGEAAGLLLSAARLPKPAKPGISPKANPSAAQPDADADAEDAEEEEEPSYPESFSRDTPGIEPAEPGQLRQLLDTILNFAPLEQLAAGVNQESIPDEGRILLRQVIAARHLARERFEEAQPFMTPAEWNLRAARLAELTAAAKAATTPAAKATAAMKLADAWAANRGKLLTVPLDTEEWRRALMKDEHALANSRRSENAEALGLKGATVLDLENRDELRHAFNWWLEASDAQPKMPLAATAVWRALRAMRDIADVSPFTLDRAAAKNWAKTSRSLYHRLQKEHPSSVEAKRLAVWWTFPEVAEEPGTEASRAPATSLIEKVSLGEVDDISKEDGEMILGLLNPEFTSDVTKARQRVLQLAAWAEGKFTAINSQCVQNFFDDLVQFFAVENLTPDVARRYMELRYDVLWSAAIGFGPLPIRPGAESKDAPGTVRGDEAILADIAAALADPAMKRVADFLSYLEIAVVANHWVSIPLTGTDKWGENATYWGRDYLKMEKMCREWLAAHPKSPKREAALLLHCRALRHAMEPYVFWKHHTWPMAARWEGEEKPVEVPRLAFDAKTWKAALDRYSREFPKGRYGNDVEAYHADFAMRTKDWKRAITITLRQLEGPAHLQPPAQNRLRYIFSRLVYDEDRADVIAAVRAVPGARGALDDHLAAEEETEQPLDWMREWLSEQTKQ